MTAKWGRHKRDKSSDRRNTRFGTNKRKNNSKNYKTEP